MSGFLTFCSTLGLVALACAATAQSPEGLQPGDPAPAFTLPGSDGKTHALADFKGKTVVLSWFAKAFTGG